MWEYETPAAPDRGAGAVRHRRRSSFIFDRAGGVDSSHGELRYGAILVARAVATGGADRR